MDLISAQQTKKSLIQFADAIKYRYRVFLAKLALYNMQTDSCQKNIIRGSTDETF